MNVEDILKLKNKWMQTEWTGNLRLLLYFMKYLEKLLLNVS